MQLRVVWAHLRMCGGVAFRSMQKLAGDRDPKGMVSESETWGSVRKFMGEAQVAVRRRWDAHLLCPE